MKKTEILAQLENLCKRLSIFVKYDRFFGRGGYCRLKDKAYFIINERLSNETKKEIFVNELKSLNFDTETLPPKLKDIFTKK